MVHAFNNLKDDYLNNAHYYKNNVQEEGYNMPQIRPITDLRNTNEISELCHTKHESVFMTKNGYGDLVIMSIETYEEMIETSRIDNVINEMVSCLMLEKLFLL